MIGDNTNAEIERKTNHDEKVKYFLALADYGKCAGSSGGQKRSERLARMAPEIIDLCLGNDSESIDGFLRLIAYGVQYPSLRADLKDMFPPV